LKVFAPHETSESENLRDRKESIVLLDFEVYTCRKRKGRREVVEASKKSTLF
jgi:hypothetical protein